MALDPIVFLPGKFLEQRSLVGYSPWGCKELDTTENAPTTTLSLLRHTDNPGAWSSGLGNLRVQPFILLS